ncbi:hypothetical protein AB2L57_08190 [Microbacterium sp. HA-8]|uniref:hypothetical protein n=1 Tax=Microbacterium sp. HA-8 TaxID=3234200 RepID=UPI0038F76EC2
MRAPILATPRTPRVNLMPRAEIERRRRAALVRTWAWVLVAALAAVAVTAGAAFVVKLAADQRLALEQARTAELLTELAALTEVSSALTSVGELGAFRADAMGTDILWRDTVSGLAGALPAGVSITGFDVVVGAAPVVAADTDSDVAADTAVASAAASGLTGTLTLTSATPLDMAGTIRGLRDVAGVKAVDGRDVTSTDTDGATVYTYLLELDLDQSIYSGRYAAGETE